MQLGSMFISNCNITLHVLDAFCVHPQEYLKTVVAASGVWLHPISCHTPEAATTVFKCSWGWTRKASETCTVILQLLINILPSCITLVLYIYLYYVLPYVIYSVLFHAFFNVLYTSCVIHSNQQTHSQVYKLKNVFLLKLLLLP